MKTIKFFLISLSFVLLTLIATGQNSGKVGTITWGPTLDFFAISVAISKNEYDLPGYLGYHQVGQKLAEILTSTGSTIAVNDDETRKLCETPNLVGHAISAAAKIDKDLLTPSYSKFNAEHAAYQTLGGEDVGYGYFYSMAFKIFGYNQYATHLLYVLILVISVLAFIYQFRDRLGHLYLLTFALAALFLVSNSNALSSMVANISSNRFLVTLAIVPLIHLATLIRFPTAITVSLLSTLVQSFILANVVFFRSSGIWIIFLACIFCIAGIVIKRKYISNLFYEIFPSREGAAISSKFSNFPAFIGIPLLLLLVNFGFKAYQNAQLDDVYFSGDMTKSHVVWHSAWIGLSTHPKWQEHLPRKELADRGGDGIPFRLSELVAAETGQKIVGGAKGGLTLDGVHERILKNEFFNFVRKNPRYVLELYLFYKPLNILKTFVVMINSIPGLLLFGALTLSLLLVAVSCYYRRLDTNDLGGPTLATSVVFLASLAPNVWAYPTNYAMAEQLSLFFMLLIMIASYVVAFVFDFTIYRGEVRVGNRDKYAEPVLNLSPVLEQVTKLILFFKLMLRGAFVRLGFLRDLVYQLTLFLIKALLVVATCFMLIKFIATEALYSTQISMENLKQRVKERRPEIKLFFFGLIDNPVVFSKLSYIYEEQGRLDKALEVMELAIGSESDPVQREEYRSRAQKLKEEIVRTSGNGNQL